MAEEEIQKGKKDLYQCLGCHGLWDIDGVETFIVGGDTKYVCKKCKGNCLIQTETPKEEIEAENLYQCLECRGLWGIEGVETFVAGGVTRYTCKECRGACLIQDDLKKRTGVKSIKQKFKRIKIGWYILLILICYAVFWFFQSVVTMNDYRNYLIENADTRKKINSKLHNFKKDHIIAKDKKASTSTRKDAQIRINSTKKYILSFRDYVDKMNKPDKPEIIKLYTLEKSFWSNPSYENYLNYSGTFNDLKSKYDLEYFEYVKDIVRKRLVSIKKAQKK